MSDERDIRGKRSGQNAGCIIIPPDVNVWPHELKTAEALANAGYVVEFVRKNDGKRAKSADLLIEGALWEMKAPTSGKPSVIEKNIRKALHQAKSIIFDSNRMKGLSDAVVERELKKCAVKLRSIKRLMFVNRRRQLIDIK